MKMTKYLFSIYLLSSLLIAQSKIEQLNWMQGNWSAEKWGGIIEEYWSNSNGNMMIGMFRFIHSDEVQFTEHFMLYEENGNPTIKLRHFSTDFTAWEEKNEPVVFNFKEMGINYLQLDGIRYELTEQDQLRVLLEIDNDGQQTIEEFLFSRF